MRHCGPARGPLHRGIAARPRAVSGRRRPAAREPAWARPGRALRRAGCAARPAGAPLRHRRPLRRADALFAGCPARGDARRRPRRLAAPRRPRRSVHADAVGPVAARDARRRLRRRRAQRGGVRRDRGAARVGRLRPSCAPRPLSRRMPCDDRPGGLLARAAPGPGAADPADVPSRRGRRARRAGLARGCHRARRRRLRLASSRRSSSAAPPSRKWEQRPPTTR